MEKYSGPLVVRTPLIVNGHNTKYIQKAYQSSCDCIVLDLEDGVPPNYKDLARKTIFDTLNSGEIDGRPVFVRVNSLETGMTKQDVDMVASKNLNGFLYTKPYSSGDLVVFDRIISEKEKSLGLPQEYFKVIVVMETPSAIIHADEIAKASKRIVGMLFGAEDLLGDTQGKHASDGSSLHYARSQVLFACRANNLLPIDTPYIDVHNIEGLKAFIKPAVDLGYEGMLLISPSQAEIVKDFYTPSASEIQKAQNMVSTAQANASSGTGASIKEHVFVAPPTLKQANNLIYRHEKIVKFEQYMKSCRENA